jgi:hypothetical protein
VYHTRMTQGYTPPPRRVTVRAAADELGISEGAVRMRIKRGTLPSTREGDRLYVLLHTDPTPDPTRSTNERLISSKDETIAVLREQLEAERDHLQAEREAHAEARRLLAAALERIPLEAPERPSEAPTGAPTGAAAPRPGTPGPPPAETPAEGRPWWRRWVGG